MVRRRVLRGSWSPDGMAMMMNLCAVGLKMAPLAICEECGVVQVRPLERKCWNMKILRIQIWKGDIKKVQNARKERKMWERKLASGISQLAFIKVCQIPLALFPTRCTSYYFLLFFLWITCLFHLLHLLSFSKQTFCYTKIKNFKKGKMQNCEPITVDNSFALWRQVFALSKYWKFVQTKTHNFPPNIPSTLNRDLPVEGKTNITTSSKLHRSSEEAKLI